MKKKHIASILAVGLLTSGLTFADGDTKDSVKGKGDRMNQQSHMQNREDGQRERMQNKMQDKKGMKFQTLEEFKESLESSPRFEMLSDEDKVALLKIHEEMFALHAEQKEIMEKYKMEEKKMGKNKGGKDKKGKQEHKSK